MKILRILSCLILAPLFLGATEIQSYELRLATAPDGSGAAQATLRLTSCTPGQLKFPLGFIQIQELHLLEAPQGARLETGPTNGQMLLHAYLPEGLAPEATLRFSFSIPQAFFVPEPGLGEKSNLPEGSRLFRHAFVNTQEGTIGSYRFELLFPEHTMAQSIREQLPKAKKSEVGPRVLLTKLDGRQAAVLQLSTLKQGDDTSMLLEVVPERKTWGWLLVGLALAAIYLVYFRDLVAPKKA
ncbi:MAG: hypothetical protein IPN59_01835 [Holophaga sp.]|nr:hypothetical protein [Holophaga sp.]